MGLEEVSPRLSIPTSSGSQSGLALGPQRDKEPLRESGVYSTLVCMVSMVVGMLEGPWKTIRHCKKHTNQ